VCETFLFFEIKIKLRWKMENNKIPSEDENKALENAKAFAEEAKYDIEAADELVKNLDLNNCENDDRVFYLGRRSFFFLQQAVEKISKAYAFLLYLQFLDITSSSEHISLPQEKRDILKDIPEKLQPKRMSHSPHIALLYTFSKFSIFAKESNIIEHFKSQLDNELNKIDELYRDKQLEPYEPIISPLRNACFEFKQSIETLFNNPEFKSLMDNTLEECKIIVTQPPNILNCYPPCIQDTIISGLKTVDNLKCELFNRARTAFEKEEKSFLAGIKRPSPLKLTEDQQNEFFKKFKDAPNFLSYWISFKFILPIYLILLSHSLAWYESGGRYPNVDYFDKGNICKDIEKIKLVDEKIKSTLDIINNIINWKERSSKEKWPASLIPLALF
jgi:hypothetical protein